MSQETTISQPQQAVVLSHLPDFQQGVLEGQQAVQEGVFSLEEEKVWTDDQVIRFIQKELNVQQYTRNRRLNELMNHPPSTYLHLVGFLIGYLDQMIDRLPL